MIFRGQSANETGCEDSRGKLLKSLLAAATEKFKSYNRQCERIAYSPKLQAPKIVQNIALALREVSVMKYGIPQRTD